jgi:hypothetical protein
MRPKVKRGAGGFTKGGQSALYAIAFDSNTPVWSSRLSAGLHDAVRSLDGFIHMARAVRFKPML